MSFRLLSGLAATLCAGSFIAALAGGCSAKHDPTNGILLAVDTNLKVPDDIDTIGISVTLASNVNDVTEDDQFTLAPGGAAKFPATLGIVRGTSEPLQIRAVGYKDGAAVAMRQAVTTLPADRVALLNFELNWLDKPLVAGTTMETVRSVTTTCGDMETPLAGTCSSSSFQLDSLKLPTYAPSALAPSDGPAAVDCDTCFAGAQAVTVDAGTCTFHLPPGDDADAINVVFQLAAGHTAGWCNGASCIIPLPNDTVEGWSLGPDGLIHLPPAACTSAAVGAVLVAPASAQCPVLSSDHPAKQSYGTDGGVVTSDGGAPDATVPDASVADAAVDAAMADAGPLAEIALPDITALAADSTGVYALTTNPLNGRSDIWQYDLHFASAASALADVAVPTRLPAPDLSAPAAAVGNGFFAFATSTAIDVVDVGASTNATSYPFGGSGVVIGRLDIATDDEQTTRIAFNETDAGTVAWATVGTDRMLAATDAGAAPMTNVAAFVRNPYFDGGGAPVYTFYSATSAPGHFGHATLGGTVLIDVNSIPNGAVQMAVRSEGPAWLYASTYDLEFIGGSYYDVDAGSDPPSEVANSLAETETSIFVANSGGSVDEIYTGDAGVVRRVPLLADAGSPTSLRQLVVQGDSLYWFDSDGLHRNLLSTIP